MIKMNEEVYLQNLMFKKTYNDKGLVIGEIVFKNRMSLEEYTNIQEKKDLILCDKLQNNWNELKKLIDERIGDCRYFLANADVNYEKENMKKFMWLKEELQILKSKAQELEQGKDE